MDIVVDALPALMFVALAVMIFTGFPVAFSLAGIGIGFGFLAYELGAFSMGRFTLLPLRIYGGLMENLILVAIPMFVFMGTMLEKSGCAEDLLHTLKVLLRRVPGGLALSVTTMGTILAATTGIIGASVVLMSLMALPVMLKSNYSPALATGTIASAGTLGILIPPSIMLVIMADLLSVPVGTLFLGAVIPGLMLATFYLIYIVSVAAWKPETAPPLPKEYDVRDEGGLPRMIMRSFLPPVALIVMVLGSIFGGLATPTEAAGIGAFGATLIAMVNGRLNFTVIKEVCERTVLTGGMIFALFVGATCFSLVFKFLGGDKQIIALAEATGAGNWGVLITVMVIVFLLGFFFDWIEITLIVLPIFAPIIAALDFGDHLPAASMVVPWFAILVAINLQTSFLTPPFGFALFYVKGSAPPSVKIQQIYRGIIPFVLLQLLGLALVIAFPAIALQLPMTVLN